MADKAQGTFGFGKGDDGVSTKGKRWKGEEGRAYRFSFVWWPGVEQGKPDMGKIDKPGEPPTEPPSPNFVGAQTHFIENVGFVRNKGPEYTAIAGGVAPKFRIATPVIIWPCDAKGVVDKAKLAAGDVEVKIWVFNSEKYDMLQKSHNEFPLGQHDITVTCVEAKFQKINITPCKNNLLRVLLENPGKGQPLLDKIFLATNQILATIQDEVGRDMTIEQIQAKLRQVGGAGAAAPAATVTTGVTTGAIDDIVDGLLDN